MQSQRATARQRNPESPAHTRNRDRCSPGNHYSSGFTRRLVRHHPLPALTALVCNAGVQTGATEARTIDGFESTVGVNHLGDFLLVNELLPVLEAPSRVVVVSSDTHNPDTQGVSPAWNDPQALTRGELGPAAPKDTVDRVAGSACV